MIEPRQLIADTLATAEAPCVTSSFQANGVVLLHMLRQIRPDIPVLFIDTFHHFPETVAYADELTARWGLNRVTLGAGTPEIGAWRRDADACCRRHKVEPLFAALEGYDVWFSALRRAQASTREDLPHVAPFRLPSGKVLRKVSPLASWSTRAVWDYARAHDIPLLPLYERGYASIGCEPCTAIPFDPDDPRSGRWQGQKLECGIHVQG